MGLLRGAMVGLAFSVACASESDPPTELSVVGGAGAAGAGGNKAISASAGASGQTPVAGGSAGANVAGSSGAPSSVAGAPSMPSGGSPPIAGNGGSIAGAAGAPSAGSGGSIAVAGSGGAAADGCDANGQVGVCLSTSACDGDRTSVPGFCPGPADIQCCVATTSGAAGANDGGAGGAFACDPNAAPLPNEGLVEAAGLDGCPSGMALGGSICVDVYEASLVLADDSASWSPFHNPGMTAVRAVSIAGAVPQAYIDQIQAAAACVASGKRLCTDTEWLAACQGPSGDTYPYGDALEVGVCNDHRDVHPAVELYGTTDPSIYSHLDNACLDQLPASLDTCGARTGCITSSGQYDMMGNLHEWTADPNGSFRGGYYVDTKENGPGCLYVTTAHDVSYWDYSTGFRCCADGPT